MDNKLDTSVVAFVGNMQHDFGNEILLNWFIGCCIMLKMRAFLEPELDHGYTTGIFTPFFARCLVLAASTAVISNFRSRRPYCRAEILEIWFKNFATEKHFDIAVFFCFFVFTRK
jgi:hypothetical protein